MSNNSVVDDQNNHIKLKDNNGNTASTEKGQAASWVEHFTALLNRPY